MIHRRIWGVLLATLALPCASAFAQKIAGIPPGTPHLVGHGTVGYRAFSGPAAPEYYWFCEFDAFGNPTNIGELAEDVHLAQAGLLSSITFTYYTTGGPGTGTTTATINVYEGSPTTTLPPAGLLASYTIPGLPYAPDTTFTETFDIPTPIHVPQDLWIGVKIDVPTDPLLGGAGSLMGAGVFGADGTPLYGSSTSFVWTNELDCAVPPVGLLDLAEAYGVIANHNLVVRVIPENECPDALSNGTFESGLDDWLSTGSATVVDGFTVIVTATDACEDPSEIQPISVRVLSNEPDDAIGNGDGNTTGDVGGIDGYAAPVDVTGSFSYDALTSSWTGTVLLRSERSGTGEGRKYTIEVSASDSHGNDTTASSCVVVPHARLR